MATEWRKSSFSEDSDGNCLELAVRDGAVLVRESDDPDVILALRAGSLAALLDSIKSDRIGHLA